MAHVGKMADKVALITGAGTGLGREMAKLFAAEGAMLVLAARRKDLLEETAAQLRAETLAVTVDVTDEDQVAEMVRRAVERFGRVDVLLNNAAKPSTDVNIWEQPLAVWNETLAVNLTGPMLCIREVTRQSMLERRRGAIVNFSSTAGIQGIPRKSQYCVSKSGLRMLTQVAAKELGPYNIRVNCLVPGFIQTDVLTRHFQKVADDRGVPFDQVRDESAKGLALRHVPLPEETARTALFLASDDAAIVTGQYLVADSGMVMGS
jgi:3-oxoacyl-[acyl-carrier protein] reductase